MGQVNCSHGSRDDPEPGQQRLLTPASPELREQQRVRVTQGRRTKKRDILLFKDSLVIAKAKRDSAPRPELCLALALLQVFSSGKGAASDGTKEEEGKEAKSLVFVWPWGSCIVTFWVKPFHLDPCYGWRKHALLIPTPIAQGNLQKEGETDGRWYHYGHEVLWGCIHMYS